MSQFAYVEDLFLEFYRQTNVSGLSLQSQDQKAANSFYSLLLDNRLITVAQSNYILRILTKHRSILDVLNLSAELIDNPKWKHEFRIVEHDCRAWIEFSDQRVPMLLIKHPWHIKEMFEKEVCRKETDSLVRSQWDPEQKVRSFYLFDINPVLLEEFLRKEKFIIEQSLLDYFMDVEKIWDTPEVFYPHATIDNGNVCLINAEESAVHYFSENKKNKLEDDLLLANELGFRLITPHNISWYFEIFKSKNRFFWIEDINRFFEFSEKIQGKKVIIVNSYKAQDWIKTFLLVATSKEISHGKIKVGFRERNSEKGDFNQWVKDNNLGGDLKQADYLIFRDKPPKWLFNSKEDVKIVVINDWLMPSSQSTQSWLSDHHCVVFLGQAKPSTYKGKKVVKL